MIRIVVLSPRLDLAARVLERFKPVHVQAFVAEPSIEGFDRRVIGRFPRRLKSRITLFVYAHRSMAAPTNSLPLSRIRELGPARPVDVFCILA
jgi:hypothetical protein